MCRLLVQPGSVDTLEREEADAEGFPLWLKQTRKWSLAELKIIIIKKKNPKTTNKPNLNKILNKTDIKI